MNPTVTTKEIKCAIEHCGIREGDVVLVHSSLKACGYVEGGADAVIDAFLDVLGNSGTLVMPTLSQKNFRNAYLDWSMDRPSDVGLITETFRLRSESVRSNQATHSVAAQGPLAVWLTRDHGRFGRRRGAFGDTPFAVCSPWQKMYDINAKIFFFGVDMESNTMKHLIEYQMIDDLIGQIDDDSVRDALASRLRTHATYDDDNFVWPYSSGVAMQKVLDEMGLLRHAECGNGHFVCCRARDTNDASRFVLLKSPENWYSESVCNWLAEAQTAGRRR